MASCKRMPKRVPAGRLPLPSCWFVILSVFVYIDAQAAVLSTPLQHPRPGPSAFTPVDLGSSGIVFTNSLEEFKGASNRVLFNGSGLALGDVDGDGWVDVFFCGIDAPNELYRNLGGWRFEKKPLPEALALPGFPSRGACWVDINEDARLDLLLTTVGGGTHAFIQQDGWQWIPAPDNAGLSLEGGAGSMALADVDGDGDVDLYVAYNRSDDIRDRGRVNLQRVGGQLKPSADLQDRILVHQGQVHEYGEVDILYENVGKGRFQAVSWTDGNFRVAGKPLVSLPRDWGLSVTFRDVNGDLAPDLYVCNDYWTPDRLWINDRKGGFDAVDDLSWRVSSASSMGVDMADVNGDGMLDFFVVDMLSRSPSLRKRQQPAFNALFGQPQFSGNRQQVMHNTLLMQGESESFVEASHAHGLQASDWSWGPMFMDVDLDGDVDLIVSAGYPHDVQDLDAIAKIAQLQHSWERYQDPVALKRAFATELMEHYRFYPRLNLPMIAFENQGNGRFVEQTQSWGLGVEAIHQGFAIADMDGDGDQDLVVNDLNGPPSLFENHAQGHRIAVRLMGQKGNPQGIGAKIQLSGNGLPTQEHEVVGGGRYLSGGDPMVVFGISEKASELVLRVQWREGGIQTIGNIQPGFLYQVSPEETDGVSPAPNEAPNHPWQWVSSFDTGVRSLPQDPSLRQPLLPVKKNRVGTLMQKVAGDAPGRSMNLMGFAHQGNHLTLYRETHPGNWQGDRLGHVLEGPLLSMLALSPKQWLIYRASNANGKGSQLERLAYSSGEKLGGKAGPEVGSLLRAGPLKGAEGLSILAGAGSRMGHWPGAETSMMFQWKGGELEAAPANRSIIGSLGLVHDAIWSDLNADGYPELLVASPWSDLRVFENRRGSLFDVTQAWGFGGRKGFWLSVTTLDINGDGRMDVIAGNLGRNTSWQVPDNSPFRLAYGTFSNPAQTDVIELASKGHGEVFPSRLLDEVGQYLPFFFQQVPNYAAYSEASLKELMGDRFPLVRELTATTFESLCFINEGSGSFKAAALPEVMQWGALTQLMPMDLDADGCRDLAWIQNQLWTRPGLMPGPHPRIGFLRGSADEGSFALEPLLELKDISPVDWMQAADSAGEGPSQLIVGHRSGRWHQYRRPLSGHRYQIHFKGPSSNPGALGTQFWFSGSNQESSALYEVNHPELCPGEDGFSIFCHIGFLPSNLHVRWPGGMERVIDLTNRKGSELSISW